MRKEYIRTTHNFNNETREWEYREELRENDKFISKHEKTPLGVHALESDRWRDLQSVIHQNRSYMDQNPFEYSNEDWANINQNVEDDLELYEKFGLLKSRERK